MNNHDDKKLLALNSKEVDSYVKKQLNIYNNIITPAVEVLVKDLEQHYPCIRYKEYEHGLSEKQNFPNRIACAIYFELIFSGYIT